MPRRVRPVQGLKKPGARRTRELVIALSEAEYEAVFEAARYTGDFAAVWARDVLLSRAAGLYRQRNLLDAA